MISVAWTGGVVTIADDGAITVVPVDNAADVYAALQRTQTRFESVEEDDGTIVEVIEQVDRSSEDHLRLALLSLPGAVLVDAAS